MKLAAVLAAICCAVPRYVLPLCFVPPTPCSWYAVHHGQPTFIGTVTAEEMGPDVLDLGGQRIQRTVQKVVFNVEESFEGTSEKTETVFGEGTTNDFRFQLGGRYLVYGFRDKDGKIRTGKCMRTAPVSEAEEDIRFLRSLSMHIGGEISGVVRLVSPGAQVGSVAGTITESGKDGDHKARVPDSGTYEVKGLAPGDYRETFTPADVGTEFVNLKLSIPVNGSCAESGVRLGNVTVSGSVIDVTGKPIAGSDVLLFYALDGRFHPDVLLKVRTDASGNFSLQRVEAARFILAAQPANSEMTFFPDTRDASQAKVIEIQEATPLAGLVIRIRQSRKN
jgi:hypothetical protein